MPDLSRTFHMWWGKRGGSAEIPKTPEASRLLSVGKRELKVW